MLHLILTLVGVIGISTAFVVTDTLAVYTDQETNSANAFDTGSVDLADAPDSAVVTFTNMAPGNSVIQPLTVTNSGSLDLRYAMTATVTNADGKSLRDQLVLTVRTQTANPCSSEDGTVLYGPAVLSAGAFGDSTQGAQAGDRTLLIGASESLCFKVELPAASANSFQSAAATVTFTFDAEQTTNNP